MTNYEYFNVLDAKGEFVKLYKKGVISPKYAGYLQVYRTYLAISKDPRLSRGQAIKKTMTELTVGHNYAYKAVKFMESIF